MKRIILSLFVLLMGSFGAIAQIDINPSTIALVGDGADQIYIDILITNNNSTDAEIHWIYEPAASYPDSWKSQICDLNSCYIFDNLSSLPNLPNFIEPGQEVKFTLKIKNVFGETLPVNGSSYGILRLFDDPDKTNEIAATSPLTSTVDLSNDDLVIYPNPTTESFQLKNDASVSNISIYNIVGRLVKTFDHSKGMIHDVTTLRTGMYLVRLENNDGDVLKSMRLSKK